MAQTAAQRAVEVFVSAVEARGGKAEVTTKGSTTLVTVTANGRTETLRVKATTGDSWQARKSEAAVKAPVTAWALVDLSDGAPIALASAADYAAHVAKLAAGWEGKNPGKALTANTNLTVTADAVAGWEDAWAVLGLDGAAAAPAKPAAAKPAAESAAEPAAKKTAPAKKAPAKKATPAAKKTTAKAPAKKAPAKSAAKPAAKTASKSTAKSTAAKPAASKPAATKAAAKPAAKKTPVKASEAKITPIAAQKDAASKGKAPASIDAKTSKPAAKTESKAETKAAPTAKADVKAEAPSKDVAKAAPKKGQPSGIALLLKRLPVVGRLL